METTERKYALTKLQAGDWLCPSNDRRYIWRFFQYPDGSKYGLCDHDGKSVDFEKKYFWEAARVTIEKYGEMLDNGVDPEDYAYWDTVQTGLPSRGAAIEVMLEMS